MEARQSECRPALCYIGLPHRDVRNPNSISNLGVEVDVNSAENIQNLCGRRWLMVKRRVKGEVLKDEKKLFGEHIKRIIREGKIEHFAKSLVFPEGKEIQQIAYIMNGHSQYDDGVWGLLGEFDSNYFHANDLMWCGYDYLYLTDCFVLAGASVNTVLSKYGDAEITLTIPKGRKEIESFLWRLRKKIIEKTKRTSNTKHHEV